MVFGSLGNMANLLKSAKEMQANMARMQEELSRKRHQGDAGGGMVRATVDGKGGLVDIKIDPSAVQDVELLEDLIKSAVGLAVQKSQEAMQQEMSALTGGIDVSGFMNMLGGKT